VPVWGYLLLGFVILALVALTFRRNTPVSHPRGVDYGADFRQVFEAVARPMEELRAAVREGQERPVAMAASRARSRVHASIQDLDRLDVTASIPEAQRELLESLRRQLRQAMDDYEWAARIAETTDLIDNQGLRRAFESLTGSGDQLCADARFQLAGIGEAGAESPA
jgi:hypothetical protein